MVDPGEQVSVTVRREFMEEALDSGSLGSTDKAVIEQKLKSFFDSGKELYKGYVDDPRNTDNAWMETVKFPYSQKYTLKNEIIFQQKIVFKTII